MKYGRLGAGAVAAAAITLAACGGSPAAMTSHGTMGVTYSTGTGLLGGTPGIDPFSDGTQVVVIDSKGTVIGTGTLASYTDKANQAVVAALGGSVAEDDYKFTVTVPGGETRYGIQVGTGHGTVWVTPAEMKKGPALTLTP